MDTDKSKKKITKLLVANAIRKIFESRCCYTNKVYIHNTTKH